METANTLIWLIIGIIVFLFFVFINKQLGAWRINERGYFIMKKAISFFIIITMLVICSIGNSFADDFSVRNGIQFGMSVDEVKQIEKSNGMPDDNIYLDGLDYLKTCYQVGYKNTSVAGVNNIDVIYTFNKDTKILEHIKYQLGVDSTEEANSAYNSMAKSLTDKYGEPRHTDTASYNEWIVDFDDYSIIIYEACYDYYLECIITPAPWQLIIVE